MSPPRVVREAMTEGRSDRLRRYGRRGAMKANKTRREKKARKEHEEAERREAEEALSQFRKDLQFFELVNRRRAAHEDICPVDD